VKKQGAFEKRGTDNLLRRERKNKAKGLFSVFFRISVFIFAFPCYILMAQVIFNAFPRKEPFS
jgi:hypothetical protein